MQTDQMDALASTHGHPVEGAGGPMRPEKREYAWWIAVLCISFACFAGMCVWLSAHRMMWDDEFDAWHLIADPSWRHALASWNAGADGGPPLYYAIARLIVKVTGLHPLALRLYTTFCFWAAAVLWVQILKRYFGGAIAIGGAAFAFLCNFDFVDQLAQVRFYGQLVLGVVLSIWLALYVERKRPALGRCVLLSALGGFILVLSHPLGIVYSANIAAAQLFGKAPIRHRIAAISGTVLSWSGLLVFIRGVQAGAETTNWLKMPPFLSLVHFYDNYPLLLVTARYVSVLVNLGLLCLIAYTCWWFLRRRASAQMESGSLWLFFCTCVLLLLAPWEFFLVSHLYKPLFLSRYMLPYTLGFSGLAAAGAWVIGQRISDKNVRGVAAFAGILVAGFAVLTFKEQAVYPLSRLEPILRVAQSEPVVFQHPMEVLQAHFYAPSCARNLFYLLPPLAPGQRGTLNAVAQQGYEPEIMIDRQFLTDHREFLYLENPYDNSFYDRMTKDPDFHSEDEGSVIVEGIPEKLVRFTRVANH